MRAKRATLTFRGDKRLLKMPKNGENSKIEKCDIFSDFQPFLAILGHFCVINGKILSGQLYVITSYPN